MLIEDGPSALLVLSKGCAAEADHEPRVTQHRTGPGLSVVSYTHVCRHGDFCNDLSTSAPVWAPPLQTDPGSLQCPHCLSTERCPEDASVQLCPKGTTHCYKGELVLTGENIFTRLQVRGCMSQPGCNLLNGTQDIGPVMVKESCDSRRRQALFCQFGRYKAVHNISELHLQWTVNSEKECDRGWGCQDSLMLIRNGPSVLLVLSKGCTAEADHEPRVTQHRTGPGLSVVSYTHVCRHGDFCNDLATSFPLGELSPETDPGSLQCPHCLSTERCPEDASVQLCPKGTTHCYKGELMVTGENIFTRLQVRGCMSQPGCNLLNGTQDIGSVMVKESCDSRPTLTCYKGISFNMRDNLTYTPVDWTSDFTKTCDAGQVCQETMLLIDVGLKSLLLWSKGCSQGNAPDPQTTSLHAGPTGVLVASYAHFCSSDLCNRASSSSVLLKSLPRPAAPEPGDLRCASCVQAFGHCSDHSPNIVCPKGTTHCYNGHIHIQGGGLTTSVAIEGCVAQPSTSLLNHSRNIGIFSVREDELYSVSSTVAASATFLTRVMGLGLALAFWCGGLCLFS
ncbi:CD177 antigen isoform X2 [Nycticebus coucang]|nr:CD177 antigen isoform X2 [Nycticebus coucang]